MFPGASYPCRVALTNAVALTKKPSRSFLRQTKGAKKNHGSRLCFSSSSEPPYSGEEHYAAKRPEKRSYKSSGIAEIPTHWPRARGSHRHHEKEILSWSNSRRMERGNIKRSRQRRNNEGVSSLVHSSQYSYRLSSEKGIPSILDSSDTLRRRKSAGRDVQRIMQSMDASALLDPLKYCKGSAKLPPYVHSGSSRSISGTDAARRLLSGKRKVLMEASKLDEAPFLLDGHGVPPALFQHCVDMAGALLRHYGPDIVECSFHNKYGNRKTSAKVPHHVRVRRRDTSNVFLPPPSPRIDTQGEICKDGDNIDWNYNFTLYLTVMERLAKSLGQVFELSSFKHQKLIMGQNSHEQYDNDDDDCHDFDISSPQFALPPLWNVGVYRGAYFDFETVVREGSATGRTLPPQTTNSNHFIRPFPVVEFVPQKSSRSSGRILIRLQGYPVANQEFNGGSQELSEQHYEQPVSLVFDACIQKLKPMRNLVHSGY